MSLRDQLLKAGLANQKQAKKAERALRDEKKQKKKGQATAPSESDAIQDAIQREMVERRERDRQLNLDREREREAREAIARAREYVFSHDQKEFRADLPYYFVQSGRYIRTILVTEAQLKQLEKGRLGIATLEAGDDDAFYLLSREDCERVAALNGELLVCLHSPEESTIS